MKVMVSPTHFRHLEKLHNAAPIGLWAVPPGIALQHAKEHPTAREDVSVIVLEDLRKLGYATYDVTRSTYRITEAGEDVRRQGLS